MNENIFCHDISLTAAMSVTSQPGSADGVQRRGRASSSDTAGGE